MRLTTVKTEVSLDALADRLYNNLTPDKRKRVVAALLKANPQLAGAEAFRPGVVVRLPEQPGLTLKTAETGKDPVGELMGGLKEAVAGYGEQLMKNLGAALTDLKNQDAILKQKEVAAAIKAAPEAAKLADSLTASLRDRGKALTDERKTLDTTLGQIAKDIDSLG